MADDLIKVDIKADYDDKGAKAAKKDLDAIDGREAEAEVSVDDNASQVTGKVDSDLTAIDGRTAEATVDVDDNASAVTDQVDSDLTAIDGRTAEATVDVDDNASTTLADVDGDLDAIDGRSVHATVDADQGAGLTSAVGELREVDGGTYRATIDADQGAGLTSAVGELREVDGGTYKATIDADEGSGLTGVKDTIGAMAGSALGTKLSLGALTGPGGIIAAVSAALFGAADNAADVALEAESIANFTNSSVEDASRLAAVLRDNTSVEAADLQDIIAQMAGVLAANPGLVEQFGLKLDDVRQDPLAAFVAIVDKLGADGKLSFDELITASQLFGEEGVRQVNDIITRVGPEGLQGAMDAIAESRVIHDDDVDAARQFKQNMTEAGAALQGLATSLGTAVLPKISDLVELSADVLTNVQNIGTALTGQGALTPEEDLRATLLLLREMGPAAEEAFNPEFVEELKAGLGGLAGVLDDSKLSADEFDVLMAVLDGDLNAAEAAVQLFGESAAETTPAVDDLAESTADAAAATKDHVGQLFAQVEMLRESATASTEQQDALRAANDVFYANQKAVRDARDAVRRYNEVAADSESTADDQAEALQDVAQAADDVAVSEVDAARRTREATGATLSNTDALDIQNESLIGQASTLQGPTRQALLDHIARLNNIPPEVVSEILALLDQGKIDEAESLLNETSRTRQATVRADADNASVNQAESDLNWLSRDRTAMIRARIALDGPPAAIRAVTGGSAVNLSAAAAAPVPVPVTMSAGGGDTYNLTLPRGTRPDDVIRSLDRHARRNGRRSYAFR